MEAKKACFIFFQRNFQIQGIHPSEKIKNKGRKNKWKNSHRLINKKKKFSSRSKSFVYWFYFEKVISSITSLICFLLINDFLFDSLDWEFENSKKKQKKFLIKNSFSITLSLLKKGLDHFFLNLLKDVGFIFANQVMKFFF